MLVLTRKPGERIIVRVPGILEPIVIENVAYSPGRMRIGVTGPKGTLINREEVEQRILSEIAQEVGAVVGNPFAEAIKADLGAA
jgi:sRNA-binding carbon storage regulator CsrA